MDLTRRAVCAGFLLLCAAPGRSRAQTLMEPDLGMVHVWHGFDSNVNAFTQSAVEAQVSTIGAAPKTLYLVPGSWTFNSALSFGSNITLLLPDGVSVVGTGALTIDKLMASRERTWYSGTGSVIVHRYIGNQAAALVNTATAIGGL